MERGKKVDGNVKVSRKLRDGRHGDGWTIPSRFGYVAEIGADLMIAEICPSVPYIRPHHRSAKVGNCVLYTVYHFPQKGLTRAAIIINPLNI